MMTGYEGGKSRAAVRAAELRALRAATPEPVGRGADLVEQQRLATALRDRPKMAVPKPVRKKRRRRR